MGKFRKRPIEIEAIQWNGDNVEEIQNFMGTGTRLNGLVDQKIEIHTLEGTMTASLADWIIQGVQGEFYPCKPDIFEATYEPVL